LSNKPFSEARYSSVVMVGVCAFATLMLSDWPQIWWFASDPDLSNLMRLLTSPVHLDDDVMISLRSGNILIETGIASFNRTDLSQPSTSYLAPYIFAVLAYILPENLAVSVYAGLGFLAVLGTFGNIFLLAKSWINGALVILALTLTSTNLTFALNGWDHLFQGFFLTLAIVIAQKKNNSRRRLLFLSLLLVFAIAFRLDGLLIAISIITYVVVLSSSKGRILRWVAFPFVSSLAIILALNWYQFGYFMTTTTRLKFGSASSLDYVVSYIIKNGLLSFSSITLCIIFYLFYFIFRKQFFGRSQTPIVICCLATSLIATVNSDIFLSGRMFWASSCIMAGVLASISPTLFVYKQESAEPSLALSDTYKLVGYSSNYIKLWKILSIFFLTVLLVSASTTAIREKLRSSSLEKEALSNTAQQYRITQWIEQNMNPDDGSIGFFYLGIAYHLPAFEIGDFLGKADEMIAQSSIKWGAPGHNKWDITKTLEKWNPQVIIPAANSDLSIIEVKEKAVAELVSKEGFGWFSDLLLSEKVIIEYTYCYLTPEAGKQDNWGFFIRKDLVDRYSDRLSCVKK
jgi:hypothetical protein